MSDGFIYGHLKYMYLIFFTVIQILLNILCSIVNVIGGDLQSTLSNC